MKGIGAGRNHREWTTLPRPQVIRYAPNLAAGGMRMRAMSNYSDLLTTHGRSPRQARTLTAVGGDDKVMRQPWPFSAAF